jgi:hypothetical protein
MPNEQGSGCSRNLKISESPVLSLCGLAPLRENTDSDMREKKKIEKIITRYLQDSLNGEVYLKTDRNLTNRQMIGHGISYYLTAILREQKDSGITGKWIDDIAWENFELFPPNKVKGNGKLWWGLKKDASSKTFSEDFYCELELVGFNEIISVSYLFQFQIDGESYNLKN